MPRLWLVLEPRARDAPRRWGKERDTAAIISPIPILSPKSWGDYSRVTFYLLHLMTSWWTLHIIYSDDLTVGTTMRWRPPGPILTQAPPPQPPPHPTSLSKPYPHLPFHLFLPDQEKLPHGLPVSGRWSCPSPCLSLSAASFIFLPVA